MILPDKEIKKRLENGKLGIEYDKSLYIGPSSVDLHLDNKAKFLPEYNRIKRPIDSKDQYSIARLFEESNGWEELIINPGEFHILSTKEKLSFPNDLAGFIQGRSSLARLGINVHAAGFFDPGFSGNVTLEVTNFTRVPIVLYNDMRICQMVFVALQGECETSYKSKKDSKYNNQVGPTLSKISQDFHE